MFRSRMFGRVVAPVGAMLAAVLLAPNPAAAGHRPYGVIYSFSLDAMGFAPSSSLSRIGHVLYGTTKYGGDGSCGIFRGCGAMFSLDLDTGLVSTSFAFQNTADGFRPFGGLTEADGILYGVTQDGGSDSFGSIYAFDPSTGEHSTVASFEGLGAGAYPNGGMIELNGHLFGTAAGGGEYDGGTLFITEPGGALYPYYAFGGSGDGATPNGNLVKIGDQLYGTTRGGGVHDNGTAFAISIAPDLKTGVERFLYYFDGAVGRRPSGGLIKVGDILYGVAEGGGHGNFGTVFAIDTRNKSVRPVYVFKGQPDGAVPGGTLSYVDGMLYGSTRSGGSAGNGTIFEVDPATGTEHVLHSFRGEDQNDAPQTLLNVAGVLYGVTADGGAHGLGTLFGLLP